MKRYISIKIKQYLTIVLTSFLFPTLALLSLSSQTALAWGPERTTFNTENPAPFNTLNSIIDNPNYGDERNFSVSEIIITRIGIQNPQMGGRTL